MAIIGLFPTQNWLKNATNDISIHEFHNITRHCKKTLRGILHEFQSKITTGNLLILLITLNNYLP